MLKSAKGCMFVKWLHSGLYKEAAFLESHSCENFLKERDIRDLMGKKYGMGGFVVTEVNRPIGYTIYDNSKGVLEIVNLVVHQDYRRRGVASLLLEKLYTRSHWSSVQTYVRETNLNAHLFFKKQGFLATGVKHRYFEDHVFEKVNFEDAYHFKKEKA